MNNKYKNYKIKKNKFHKNIINYTKNIKIQLIKI